MKIYRNYALALLTFVLAGCLSLAPAPESNTERLALLQTSYGVLLDKATLYATEDRLNDDQKASLDNSFDAIESSLGLARIALDASNDIDFDNSAANVTLILSTVRSLLVEVE
jgi:hypothetical protein